MSAALMTPSERLTLSRERLRLALRDMSTPPSGASGAHATGVGIAWLDGLKSIPAANVVIEAVCSWWAQHPWRIGSVLASETVKAVVQPMAQRHPLGLVAGALLLGGVLAWTRPWRLILTPALLAGLLPQLLSKAVAQIPAQSWMAVLTELLKQPRQPQQPAQAADFSPLRPDASTR